MKERFYFTTTTAMVQIAIGLLMIVSPGFLPTAYTPFLPLLPWYGWTWVVPGLLRLFLGLRATPLNILLALWSAVNFILLGAVFAATSITGTTSYAIIGVMILLSVVSERV